MNKILTLFILLSIVIVFLYFNKALSFMSARDVGDIDFNGANSIIGFDASGNIISVPISNVNNVVNAMQDSTDNVEKRVQKNINNNSTKITNNSLSISELNRKKPDNSVLSSYVKKGSSVNIKLGSGHPGYTYNANDPKYIYGSSDNWRVAYGSESYPNAKFILN